MSKRIFAIVGLSATGKSTLSKYLELQYGMSRVHFGGRVLDEIKRRGLSITPETETLVREDLRVIHGMAAMAILSVPAIEEARSSGYEVIIDGLYSMEELQFLRSYFPDDLILIALHASRVVRVRRAEMRHDRRLSGPELIDRDEREITHLNKAPPIVLADFHFVNDGNEDTMYSWANQIIARLQ